VLLAALTLIWGTNWLLFPMVTREMSVWTFRAIAVPLSGIVLLALAATRGLSLSVPRQDWPRLGAATLAYVVVWNIASTYAGILIPSGQGAVLGFTMPLWAALIARLVLGERLSARMLLALAFGAGAVALLMVPGLKAYARAPAGFAAGIIAAIGWAVGTLIIKRHAWKTHVLVLTGWQMVLTALPIIAGAFALGDGRWFMPTWQSIAVLAYIALVPMCVGNVAWFSIVGLLPANVAGLSSILVPVVAMFGGHLVHAEPLGPAQLAAMACCAASLALALLKPAAKAEA
jgi:drug/metabolite transporter (DMT)-like permease